MKNDDNTPLKKFDRILFSLGLHGGTIFSTLLGFVFSIIAGIIIADTPNQYERKSIIIFLMASFFMVRIILFSETLKSNSRYLKSKKDIKDALTDAADDLQIKKRNEDGQHVSDGDKFKRKYICSCFLVIVLLAYGVLVLHNGKNTTNNVATEQNISIISNTNTDRVHQQFDSADNAYGVISNTNTDKAHSDTLRFIPQQQDNDIQHTNKAIIDNKNI